MPHWVIDPELTGEERMAELERREKAWAELNNVPESDPTGKNPHSPGAKMDAGKAPIFRGVLNYFPLALTAVAEVSQKGADKYAWKGWEDVPGGFERYSDAMGRHVLDEAFGDFDDGKNGTGCLHAAQVAWNALARLELKLREGEEDARMPTD